MEWQLPVTDNPCDDKGLRIHGNSKIHCFDNKGVALCSPKIWLVPGYFKTTEYGEKDVDNHPEYFCKKCVKKFKKMMTTKT